MHSLSGTRRFLLLSMEAGKDFGEAWAIQLSLDMPKSSSLFLAHDQHLVGSAAPDNVHGDRRKHTKRPNLGDDQTPIGSLENLLNSRTVLIRRVGVS
jgi:hypothetical protein